MDWQHPFIPETRIEVLEEVNQDLTKRIGELEERNQSLAIRIEAKDEEVLWYAKRLSQEEIKASMLQSESDYWKRRAVQEMRNAAELRNQCDQWQKRFTQQEENTKGLAEQYQEMKKRTKQEEEKVEVLQKHCEEWRLRSIAFEERSKQFREECEQFCLRLFEKDNKLRTLGEELKMKTQRLASTYERRLKIRQVNVENTTQLNPPSEVEKHFRDFLDEERMEAWDIIETSLFSAHTVEDDVKIRYLACMIFVAAYEQMEQTREAAKDFFNNISRHLIDEAPRRSQELCVRRVEEGCFTQFPVAFNISVEHQEWEDNKDVLDDLMLSLKESAHSCDLKCFEEDVRQMVLKRWKKCLQEEKEMTLVPPFPDKPEDVLTKLGDYIKDAIRLSWKMVTQAPPLGLEYSQLKFNQKYHTLTRLQNNNASSKQEQYDSIVYLWPGLKENEGRVIFPGEVLCI